MYMLVNYMFCESIICVYFVLCVKKNLPTDLIILPIRLLSLIVDYILSLIEPSTISCYMQQAYDIKQNS